MTVRTRAGRPGALSDGSGPGEPVRAGAEARSACSSVAGCRRAARPASPGPVGIAIREASPYRHPAEKPLARRSRRAAGQPRCERRRIVSGHAGSAKTPSPDAGAFLESTRPRLVRASEAADSCDRGRTRQPARSGRPAGRRSALGRRGPKQLPSARRAPPSDSASSRRGQARARSGPARCRGSDDRGGARRRRSCRCRRTDRAQAALGAGRLDDAAEERHRLLRRVLAVRLLLLAGAGERPDAALPVGVELLVTRPGERPDVAHLLAAVLQPSSGGNRRRAAGARACGARPRRRISELWVK